MAIGIFMESGDLVIQFPVNPEELTVTRASNNETIEIVKLGEVSIPKDSKLTTIEFSSFLPAENYYPFILTKNQFSYPEFYIDFLNEKMNNKKFFRFIVSDTNINMLVLINNFEYKYVAGTNDVNFTLSLIEYKDFKVKEVVISNNSNTSNSDNRTPETKKEVTIGCNVKVNGRLHRDSWGKGPGKTLNNYTGKVNLIAWNGYPYHITTPNGAHLGWVLKEAVEVI